MTTTFDLVTIIETEILDIFNNTDILDQNTPEDVEVVSPVFKDFKNGEYKLISFYAKKARGYMSHWMIKNKVTKSEELKNFDAEGYKYSKKLSTPSEPVFLRN